MKKLATLMFLALAAYTSQAQVTSQNSVTPDEESLVERVTNIEK